jgi:Ca-activated chloride channel family protein
VGPPASVGFLWPPVLWGLAALPLLVALYAWLLQRRSRHALSFPPVEVAAAAAGERRGIRRHLPAMLLFLAVLAIALALARPVVPMLAPVDRSAMMLSIDVSGSMMSQDVVPTRLDAAKDAARAFVRTLPARVRIGLVSFAGDAVLHMPPSAEHERVLEAIDRLSVRHRTAIGDGLVEALAALPGRVRPRPDGSLPPMPPGGTPPGVVVLLSDGQNNTGMDPLLAAEAARREQVTVYTVGVGQPPGLDRAGGFVIGGPVDEETLQAIAQRTGGAYSRASSAGHLRDIYRALARSVGWEPRPTEVTGLAAGLGAAALLAALVLSALLHPLPL